jgi:hypothetical protein
VNPTIFVLDRGWVIVGRKRPTCVGDDALFVVLDDCAVVRRWGTSKGLGQLAAEGPLHNTVLDKLEDGTAIRITSVYFSIPCDEKAWSQWTT